MMVRRGNRSRLSLLFGGLDRGRHGHVVRKNKRVRVGSSKRRSLNEAIVRRPFENATILDFAELEAFHDTAIIISCQGVLKWRKKKS